MLELEQSTHTWKEFGHLDSRISEEELLTNIISNPKERAAESTKNAKMIQYFVAALP